MSFQIAVTDKKVSLMFLTSHFYCFIYLILIMRLIFRLRALNAGIITFCTYLQHPADQLLAKIPMVNPLAASNLQGMDLVQ